MACNTTAKDEAVRFHGEGLQILWRTVVAVLWSVPVVTIPWAWLWYTRWLVQNTTIEGQPGEVTAGCFAAGQTTKYDGLPYGKRHQSMK